MSLNKKIILIIKGKIGGGKTELANRIFKNLKFEKIII